MSIDKYSSIFDLYTDPQRKVWRRQWLPIPAFSPGEIPGTEEPSGLQSMGHIESDTTEHRGRFIMFSILQKTYARYRKGQCIAPVVKGRQT